MQKMMFVFHSSEFVLVPLCFCREVIGAGAAPQSSVSHTGTADTANHPVLP